MLEKVGGVHIYMMTFKGSSQFLQINKLASINLMGVESDSTLISF